MCKRQGKSLFLTIALEKESSAPAVVGLHQGAPLMPRAQRVCEPRAGYRLMGNGTQKQM